MLIAAAPFVHATMSCFAVLCLFFRQPSESFLLLWRLTTQRPILYFLNNPRRRAVAPLISSLVDSRVLSLLKGQVLQHDTSCSVSATGIK
jgi:hypothetical protein